MQQDERDWLIEMRTNINNSIIPRLNSNSEDHKELREINRRLEDKVNGLCGACGVPQLKDKVTTLETQRKNDWKILGILTTLASLFGVVIGRGLS